VILGANRLDVNEAGSQILISTNSIGHNGFNPDTLKNDIAVVHLPSAISLTCECLFWCILKSQINPMISTQEKI
jgi:hypothetical protein